MRAFTDRSSGLSNRSAAALRRADTSHRSKPLRIIIPRLR